MSVSDVRTDLGDGPCDVCGAVEGLQQRPLRNDFFIRVFGPTLGSLQCGSWEMGLLL